MKRQQTADSRSSGGSAWLFGLLVLVACRDTPGVTVTMRVSADAPAYGDTPFPTDAVRANFRIDGAVDASSLGDQDRLGPIAGFEAIATRKLELVVAHVGALDGFGLRPLVEFFVDGDLDPDSITGNAALVDLELGSEVAMEWRYFPERGVVAGSPQSGQVLREGARHAAYVTTAVRDATGSALRPSPALGELARHPRWQPTADALQSLDVDVAGIAVFTTQHATAPLVAARDAMTALPPPVLAFDDPELVFRGTPALDRILGVATRATDGPRAGLERWGNDNSTGVAHEHVGLIATGTITIARFRSDDTETDLPGDETFTTTPVIEPIPITFIVPVAPPPADGYPVVVYGHGLGASRDQLLSFAEPLTSQGYALVGIDMVGHGSRYDAIDRVANMANQLSAFSGVASQRDGFGDTTGATTQFDFFEGFQNTSAVRDSIRQSALDLSRVVQLLRATPDVLGAKLDTRRIAYMGESFGTVVGTVFAAIEPHIDLYILDVPGGGILDLILPTSPEIAQLAVPLVETIYNPKLPLDRWNPLINLQQAVIDGADPLSYAPHVLRDRFTIAGAELGPRHVVAIEVIGDQVLSNLGTDALAITFDLDVLAPHLDTPLGLRSVSAPASANRDGQTAVLVQYSPATHGANWSAERGTLRFAPGFPATGDEAFPRLPRDITIENPIYETLDQVFEILASHRRGESPRVIITKPPTRDFDADGVTDDIDAAPFDPSHH